MSKIALLLDRFGPHRAEVIKVLRTGLRLEISRIMKQAGSGSPLIIETLFDRCEPTFAETLHPIMEQLEKTGASYRAFELLDTQDFANADVSKLYRIDSKRLHNMIVQRKASIERLCDIDTPDV